jgi:hypothetical protein
MTTILSIAAGGQEWVLAEVLNLDVFKVQRESDSVRCVLKTEWIVKVGGRVIGATFSLTLHDRGLGRRDRPVRHDTCDHSLECITRSEIRTACLSYPILRHERCDA